MKLGSGEKFFRDVAVGTIERIGLSNEALIGDILDAISRSSDLALSFKQPKKKGSLGQIVFYYQNADQNQTEPSTSDIFSNALKFTETFVDTFNRLNTAYIEVVTSANVPLWVQDDDDQSWSAQQSNVIAIKHKKSSFFRHSDFYLSGIAGNIFDAFVDALKIDPDRISIMDEERGLEPDNLNAMDKLDEVSVSKVFEEFDAKVLQKGKKN